MGPDRNRQKLGRVPGNTVSRSVGNQVPSHFTASRARRGYSLPGSLCVPLQVYPAAPSLTGTRDAASRGAIFPATRGGSAHGTSAHPSHTQGRAFVKSTLCERRDPLPPPDPAFPPVVLQGQGLQSVPCTFLVTTMASAEFSGSTEAENRFS